MADEDTFRLTDEQRSRVLARLTERIGDPKCPLCSTNRWIVSDEFVSLVSQWDIRHLNIVGRGFPSLVIICQTCGFTALLNMVVLGLLELYDSATQREKAKEPEQPKAT